MKRPINGARKGTSRRPRRHHHPAVTQSYGGHMRAYPAVMMAALAAAACGGTTDPVDQGSVFQQVEAGDTIRLRYGQSASLGTGGARIVFRSIEADSRCPINAVCVWQGDAHIRLDG